VWIDAQEHDVIAKRLSTHAYQNIRTFGSAETRRDPRSLQCSAASLHAMITCPVDSSCVSLQNTATVILITMARMFSTPNPSLPPYKSLIVQGDYHPSAPIHMCLSVPTGAKALLLSSARQALIRSLREYDDEWLLTDSGTGNTCHSSSKVDILLVPVFVCGCHGVM
jgi:hypothetical protein